MEQEESSAKRRERLLALRSAASNPTPSSPAPPPPQLPDPLLPSSAPPPEFSPRFDYYTNPAAAFSGSKRKTSAFFYNPTSNSSSTPPPPRFAGPGNYASNSSHPPPPHQHHMARSPGQSPFEMAPDAQLSSPWRSPMQFHTPMSGYRGTPPSAPPSWNPPTASPTQGYYPNSSRFVFTSSNFGRGGSPINPGPRGSPHSYSGRGRGQHYSSSPGSRGSGGRGSLSFQNRPGWQDRRSYYSKFMVEDPWQDLQPIVGNILIPRDGSKSWLPESLSVKKGKSDQGGSKLNSGLSLAEYLDLAFNETTGET